MSDTPADIIKVGIDVEEGIAADLHATVLLPCKSTSALAPKVDVRRAIFDYAVRLLVSAVTEGDLLPSSAVAIRPAIASDARRSGSLSRCA